MTHLYYVKTSYNHFTFKSLVDCGANISVISSAMMHLLGLKAIRKAGVVYGVGGKAPLIGHKQCHICIGPMVTVDFQVLQSNQYSVILGLDFLEKYKCIINTNTKKLYLNTYKIPFLNPKELLLYKLPIKH